MIVVTYFEELVKMSFEMNFDTSFDTNLSWKELILKKELYQKTAKKNL